MKLIVTMALKIKLMQMSIILLMLVIRTMKRQMPQICPSLITPLIIKMHLIIKIEIILMHVVIESNARCYLLNYLMMIEKLFSRTHYFVGNKSAM